MMTYDDVEKMRAEEELTALREKAALWDALAAMRGVEITQDEKTWAIWDSHGMAVRLISSGATLAEAVTKAMEAEGGR